MAVTFLSEEWTQAVTNALNSHPGFKSSLGSADLVIQFATADAPAGNVDYFLDASDGMARLALGTADSPDVTVAQSYDTASAISRGDLNTQTAFMTGKIKVSGNLAKLMMHQKAISEWGSAVKDLEIDY